MPPSHRMSPALLDTNAIASSERHSSFKTRVRDDSNDLVCPFGDAGVGDDPHFVDRSVKAYKRWNFGLIVNKRIHI